MKMIVFDVILCLLNLAMAFMNYKSKNYKFAMFNCFLAGGVIVAALFCAERLVHNPQ